MPELAEVETCRRVMERVLKGKVIQTVELPSDSLLLKNVPVEAFLEVLQGAKATSVGRKGKFWWINFDGRPSLCGHLGMAGWIRELGKPTARLKEHGNKPLDDESGRPRFLKLMLETPDGRRIALTDGRRLARLWLADDPLESKPIKRLGPDIYNQPRTPEALVKLLAGRTAPIKALLLDQSLFAGVGNWLADEILYQACVSPKRAGGLVTIQEFELMLSKLRVILDLAIAAEADETKFPTEWLFHHRWGGKRGSESIDGHRLVRETVGGRTTAFAPDVQV